MKPEPTFNQWINFIFDHPISEKEWWWSDNEDEWGWLEDSNPELALQFMTRLFCDPAMLINKFSRAQIDRGLNFFVSNSCSNYMYLLTNEKLPWTDRRACFTSMITLYRELMAPIYGDDLSAWATTSDPENPTYACFMWWDIIPLYGGMDVPEIKQINDAILEIFEEVLKLNSEACLESILHGLNHWEPYCPTRTKPLVQHFLRRTDISPRLRNYATAALTGDLQ